VAERAVSLSAEFAFPQWHAGGLLLRGWARTELGDPHKGVADIRDSIAGLESTGTLVWMQFAQFQLARALAATGRLAEALQVIDRIVAEIERTSGRWYAAEVLRLRGDLLLKAGRPKEDIEGCYRAARDLAQRQGAHLWQLRADQSLAAFNKG